MSIARDAGIISEAQQKEIDALFTGKDGKFDEEAFAEAFARELKRAFHETVQKRMEDVPATKAGRALRRVADFIATLAKSFAFWRQERGLDPVTGQPLQAGQVLDAFLKSARTSVDEATRLDNLARAARAASLRATAEARDNAPTQAVVDEDGTVVAYHERGDRVSAEEDAAYLDAVKRGDLEDARRMVEDAARRAGYDVESFHGTGQFGFVVFDPSFSDDKISLFFGADPILAATYQYYAYNEIAASGSQDTSVRPISTSARPIDLGDSSVFSSDAAFVKAAIAAAVKAGGSAEHIHYDSGRPISRDESKLLPNNGMYTRINTRYVGPRDYVVFLVPQHNGESEAFIVPTPETFSRVSTWVQANTESVLLDILKEKANDADAALDLKMYREYPEVHQSQPIDFGEGLMVAAKQIASGWENARASSRHGIYHTALRFNNLLTVDAKGRSWKHIDLKLPGSNRKHWKTREIAKYAKEHGYDGVRIENVYDLGANRIVGADSQPRTVIIAFDSNQVKSLDPVTYDDNGNVIPLSQRFNPGNVDIRYHISDDDRDTWNRGVRDYLEHTAKMDGDMYWRLVPKQMFSEAPDILKYLNRTGVLNKIFGDLFNEALPIKVDISVMDKIHQGTDARRIGAAHTHDLTDDDLYRLIDAISDPLAIAVSNVHPENSIVFFTELLERKVAWNGEEYYNPVLIPLLLKTRGSRNDRYYEITSAYGISNPNTWRGIIEQLSKYPDELLYVNKGKLSRHESPRFSQKGQRTYVAPKERGLRRLADTLQNVMSHSRNRVPDEWGFKKLAPELHKPSSPSIIDQPASETQGENKADPNEERRDHIHVWSGARQAYDRVDLRFIGSGTGGNNEGRGAYSSGVRGVAQDKYARGALASLTYTADNIPVVYDGKSMTLKEAYGLARETAYRNDEIDEGWMIREINYQAGQLSSDNAIVGGLVDYNELREWMLEEFENESEPLTYEEILADFSKLKALPIERRMGYDYGGGFDTRRYEGKDDKIIRSEMRDFYVDKDRFGFVHYRDVEEANRLYEEILAKMPKDSRKGNTRQKKLELLDKVLPELPETRPAVMEQTWFTNRPEGDVSHLLNWFEAVTPEQLGWIVEGARKSGFSEEEIAFLQRERIDDDDVLIEDGNRMPSGREMYMRLEVISFFRTKKKNAAYLRMEERLRRNPFEERPTEEETKGETFDAVTTKDLRRAHRDVMGDAGKFASEFLVSADIDGMMYPVDYRHGNRDGRVSGWNYVAFSDEHLRVDHVYEYNPETDDFELKWHTAEGSGPRFTETPLGQELVAHAFDAIMGSRVDLLLRPSRYYGNPYETRERNPRNALVTEHLHRDVDVSEPKGFATEVSAEISRFGTREGDPTLREIRARCGSKARFYEVLGAVYETAEAVRSGLSEVVTGRERTMMSNAGLLAAEFIKHNATARATAAGRKLYLMGREFAWKLYQEDIASAWAEVERQRRGRGDCGMIGGKCEGKGPSRHGERRWPKARRMR